MWKDVFLRGIEWLDQHASRSVPIPWRTGTRRSKRVWIGAEPVTADGVGMREPRQAVVVGRTVYVETHASAEYLVSLLRRLCVEVGVDPTVIEIELQQQA
jgi:hypothetical protein